MGLRLGGGQADIGMLGMEEVAGLGRYHVGVGVNVWSPRLGVTSVRRGLAEDGPVVAEIE